MDDVFDDPLLSPLTRASPGGGGGAAGGSNFSVVIRVRPPLERELHGDRPFENVVRVDGDSRAVTLSENLAALDSAREGDDALAPAASAVGPYATHTFTFDQTYDMHADQRRVFETTAKPVVESALAGYNATIFAVRAAGARSFVSVRRWLCSPPHSPSSSSSLSCAVRPDGHGQDVHDGGLQLGRGARHHPACH